MTSSHQVLGRVNIFFLAQTHDCVAAVVEPVAETIVFSSGDPPLLALLVGRRALPVGHCTVPITVPTSFPIGSRTWWNGLQLGRVAACARVVGDVVGRQKGTAGRSDTVHAH